MHVVMPTWLWNWLTRKLSLEVLWSPCCGRDIGMMFSMFCLLEFIEYINSLYPTIKFELVYSENTLNVLDLTLHLQDGFIITDIYAKPTDSHLYLPFSSSHPAHCKRAIPYGVALRVRRNCSTDEFLIKRCDKYKGYLKFQGYNADLVDKQFDRAINIEWSELLKKNVKPGQKVFPFNYSAWLQSYPY